MGLDDKCLVATNAVMFLYAIRRDLSWDNLPGNPQQTPTNTVFLYAIRRDLSWDLVAFMVIVVLFEFLYAIRRDLSWDKLTIGVKHAAAERFYTP